MTSTRSNWSYISAVVSIVMLGACSKASEQGPPLVQLIEKQSVAIHGEINLELLATFKKMLEANPSVRRVHLRSPGGDVVAAMEIGREIRKRRLDVVVDDRCYSSCANYLFVAGNQKSVVKGGMLLMHGGSSFRPERVFEAFPKTTLKQVANREIAKLRFAMSHGDSRYLQTYDTFLKNMDDALTSRLSNEQLELKYFGEMGVKLDLIDFSEVVSGCSGTSLTTFRVETSTTKAEKYPSLRATSRSTSEGSVRTWLSPPKQDWLASGTTNIVEFWTPSSAAELVSYLADRGKTRVETRPMSELKEADCLN